MSIAVGGFHHETNTFAPEQAAFADFEQADGWPALSRGEAMFDAVEGMNLGAAGFTDAALAAGHRLMPLLWCSASPSAHVTEDAYERITGMMLDDLGKAPSLRGVYLDLHGAMVCEHLQDGEGELLRRVRAVIGPDVPLVASLDLHANVTEQMVDLADGLIAYRTYPHVDMAVTGRRAAAFLDRLLAGERPAKAVRKAEYLAPLVWQCTLAEPAMSLYRRVEDLEAGTPGLWSASFTPGFPAADIFEVGPAVMAYGDTQSIADRAADDLNAAVGAAEPAFAGRTFAPDEAVRYAMAEAPRPLVIADTQDNPGAGGNSDTIGMLAALVRNKARNAVIGLIYDPDAAAQAHAAGVGAVIEAGVGARSRWQGEQPFAGRFEVVYLADGNFTGTGPMFGGARMQLGPMAVLRIDDVEVVLSSKKMQAADQSMFRHVGIEPVARDIIVLKSSVHFRADFTEMAGEIIVAAAPGPMETDHLKLDYRNIRPGLRRVPGMIETPS